MLRAYICLIHGSDAKLKVGTDLVETYSVVSVIAVDKAKASEKCVTHLLQARTLSGDLDLSKLHVKAVADYPLIKHLNPFRPKALTWVFEPNYEGATRAQIRDRYDVDFFL